MGRTFSHTPTPPSMTQPSRPMRVPTPFPLNVPVPSASSPIPSPTLVGPPFTQASPPPIVASPLESRSSPGTWTLTQEEREILGDLLSLDALESFRTAEETIDSLDREMVNQLERIRRMSPVPPFTPPSTQFEAANEVSPSPEGVGSPPDDRSESPDAMPPQAQVAEAHQYVHQINQLLDRYRRIAADGDVEELRALLEVDNEYVRGLVLELLLGPE